MSRCHGCEQAEITTGIGTDRNHVDVLPATRVRGKRLDVDAERQEEDRRTRVEPPSEPFRLTLGVGDDRRSTPQGAPVEAANRRGSELDKALRQADRRVDEWR